MKQVALIPLILAAAAACSTAAPQPERFVDDAEAQALATAAPIGPAQSCLQMRRIKSTEGVSDRAIIFELDGGDLYRNELPARCPGALRNQAFSYRTPSSQLCRSEILSFFDASSGVEQGACTLGDFVPIDEHAAKLAASGR